MDRFWGTNKKFLLLSLLGMCMIFLPAAACCGIGGSIGGSSTPTTGIPPATATPNLVVDQDALDGSTKSDWTNDSNCFFGSDAIISKAVSSAMRYLTRWATAWSRFQ